MNIKDIPKNTFFQQENIVYKKIDEGYRCCYVKVIDTWCEGAGMAYNLKGDATPVKVTVVVEPVQ